MWMWMWMLMLIAQGRARLGWDFEFSQCGLVNSSLSMAGYLDFGLECNAMLRVRLGPDNLMLLIVTLAYWNSYRHV